MKWKLIDVLPTGEVAGLGSGPDFDRVVMSKTYPKSTFGQMLRQGRLNEDMTLRTAAIASGMTVVEISSLERGQQTLSSEQWAQLFSLLFDGTNRPVTRRHQRLLNDDLKIKRIVLRDPSGLIQESVMELLRKRLHERLHERLLDALVSLDDVKLVCDQAIDSMQSLVPPTRHDYSIEGDKIVILFSNTNDEVYDILAKTFMECAIKKYGSVPTESLAALFKTLEVHRPLAKKVLMDLMLEDER